MCSCVPCEVLRQCSATNPPILLTLGAHAHSEGYCSCRVCMCVCMYVCVCMRMYVCVYV